MPDPEKTPPIAAKPEILAPAGHPDAFLAAIAAGADAVYCGLKQFSARMAAQNFALNELARFSRMAHNHDVKVYVAFNSMVKPRELDGAGLLIRELSRQVRPDALIVQDLSLIALARQAGFQGEIHLSTLANVSFPAALELAGSVLGVKRVVVPRELSVDEIRQMTRACPPGLDLEVFVHGALCYGVSGRCYWSSYLGGKSGLRGRCVQPCRRLYSQGGAPRRFFSCQDLSLDVLVKLLADLERVKAWKIEGRKKSPHYVYHTVKAYRLLRDFGTDPQKRAEVKKEAFELLSHALGRTANHFRFLPQRPWHPIQTSEQTGSGLLVGIVQGGGRRPYLITREALLSGDMLRVGYEDDPTHQTFRVRRFVPARGRLYIPPLSGRPAGKEAPVFLIDRRDKDLGLELERLALKLPDSPSSSQAQMPFAARLPRRAPLQRAALDLYVHRIPGRATAGGKYAIWLSEEAAAQIPSSGAASVWWWLPPVIWPENQEAVEAQVADTRAKGGCHYVINAPWQAAFFKRRKDLILWAGPFCNLANPLALEAVAAIGAVGAVVSPELGREDILAMPGLSPLPLGIVLSGSWPLCISRILAEDAATETLTVSPKKEGTWVRRHGLDYWVYPDWKLDLTGKKEELYRAGYRFFVHLVEPPPKGILLNNRPGLWNWNIDLR